MPHMTDLLIVSFLFLFLIPLRTCNADYIYKGTPPDPCYKPSKKFKVISNFSEGFKKEWPPGDSSHQKVTDDGVLHLTLDKYSGSGFMSQNEYNSLYLGAEMKLPDADYTAGLDISLFLSSEEKCTGDHDEIDIEFLGSVDKSYFHLQTNVLIKGHSSTGGQFNNVGRQEVIILWFDPREEFHSYAILKTDTSIVFFVDDIPIRRFTNREDGVYPTLSLKAYGSIWNASDWATEGGKYKLNISGAPFEAQYKNFQFTEYDTKGCPVNPSDTPSLTTHQKHTMKWIQENYRIYDYCNKTAHPSLDKECSRPQ